MNILQEKKFSQTRITKGSGVGKIKHLHIKNISNKMTGDFALINLIFLVIITQQILFLSRFSSLELCLLFFLLPILSCLRATKIFQRSSVLIVIICSFLFIYLSASKLFLEKDIFFNHKPLIFNIKSSPRENRLGEYSFFVEDSKGKYFLAQVPILLYSRISLRDKVLLRGSFDKCGSYQKPPKQLSWCGYLYRRGISGVIKVNSFNVLSVRVSKKEQFIENFIIKYGEERKSVALILASSLSEKQLLGSALKNLFKSLGLSHLLVVSGFHIGVFYSLSWFLISRVFKITALPLYYFPARVYSAVFSFLSSLIYVFVTGFEPSTSRALFALFIYSLAQVFGERLVFSRYYLFTFLLVIIIWPGIWLEMGFQLTFAALLGIYIGLEVSKKLKINFQINSAVASVINLSLLSFFAWLLTAPIIYLWTSELNLMQPIFNLLISPVFSIFCIAFPSVCFLGLYLKCPGFDALTRLCLFFVDFFIQILEKINASF